MTQLTTGRLQIVWNCCFFSNPGDHRSAFFWYVCVVCSPSNIIIQIWPRPRLDSVLLHLKNNHNTNGQQRSRGSRWSNLSMIWNNILGKKTATLNKIPTLADLTSPKITKKKTKTEESRNPTWNLLQFPRPLPPGKKKSRRLRCFFSREDSLGCPFATSRWGWGLEW